MTIEAEVQALTVATTDLLEAVNIGKANLDAAENSAELAAAQALTSANNSATSASQSAGSAAQALAIYSNTAAMQTAVSTAQAAASLAGGHAASASSVVQQDLSGVNAAALHRSPNDVTAMFVYDTGRDSDGGAWTEKCQHTSWYNEPINGKWLGAQASEAAARAVSGATTGDYYQLTSDGLFYRLNATSGTTETFRGNKRDFPRLAGIVAEASSVTIYDLTEPGRPMWIRFSTMSIAGDGATYGPFLRSPSPSGYKTIAALNGVFATAPYFDPQTDNLVVADFCADTMRQFVSAGNGVLQANQGIASRNTNIGFVYRFSTYSGSPAIKYTIPGYASIQPVVNKIALRVLPRSPVNSAGLPAPTLAVFGNNGSYLLFNNGASMRSMNSFLHFVDVAFASDDSLVALRDQGSWYHLNGLTTGGFTEVLSTSAPFFGVGGNDGMVAFGSVLIRRKGALVQHMRYDRSTRVRGSALTVTNTHNTGHQTGDIRRTYLADVGAGSATGTVSDRSYKAALATITGTLTKSEVAAAAQLVAYSGFSAVNYAQEPYSADLDFGTGEWTVSAWVNYSPTSPVGKAGVGPNLQTNGDFSNGLTGWSNFSDSLYFGTVEVVGGRLHLVSTGTNRGLFGNGGQSPWQLVVGKAYKVTLDLEFPTGVGSALTIEINQSFAGTNMGPGTMPGDPQGFARQNITGVQTLTGYFIATSTTGGINFDVPSGSVVDFYVDNVVVQEVPTPVVASRRHSSGAYIELGASYATTQGAVAGGYLTATAFDGTTTRTVTSTAAYNTATWIKARVNYTTDGTLALLVNGVQVAATRGNPLATLNNANALLTIGNSFALDAPLPGSIALLKLSATVPTAEQSAWMYEQEKHLFQAGAQCCLPDAGSIADLAYDEATDKWVAISATNESEWSGLVRTSVTAVPAGSYTRAAAGGGVQLLARSTTSPGVDVTIPAYGLREELVKRAESAARLNAQTATFDYVGGFTANTTSGNTAILTIANLTYPTRIQGTQVTGPGIPANATIADVSGTTGYLSAAATATGTAVQINLLDFALPTGLTATAVSVNGVVQREGPTAAYTRLFDGFREVIRFAVAPGNTAWVQIQTVRSAA